MKDMIIPMNPTKMAFIKNLSEKMDDLLKDLEKIEKTTNAGGENVASMLKASIEVFSESIDDFKRLEVNEKLLLLTKHSLRSGVVFMRLLKKSLEKGLTPEIKDLMKKSGLCGLVV